MKAGNILPKGRQSGGYLQIALFLLSTIGITATATVAVYKSYFEFIAKPNELSEIQKLKQEN